CGPTSAIAGRRRPEQKPSIAHYGSAVCSTRTDARSFKRSNSEGGRRRARFRYLETKQEIRERRALVHRSHFSIESMTGEDLEPLGARPKIERLAPRAKRHRFQAVADAHNQEPQSSGPVCHTHEHSPD